MEKDHLCNEYRWKWVIIRDHIDWHSNKICYAVYALNYYGDDEEEEEDDYDDNDDG